MSIDIAVPISNPCPNIDLYGALEKRPDMKNTPTNASNDVINGVLGIVNTPSTSLAISQNKKDKETPKTIINPFAISRETVVPGIKNIGKRIIVEIKLKKESLLSRPTFLEGCCTGSIKYK